MLSIRDSRVEGHVHEPFRGIAGHPVAECGAEIHERVAESASHFPVENGSDAGQVFGVEHDVVNFL